MSPGKRRVCRKKFDWDAWEERLQPFGAPLHSCFFRHLVPDEDERFVASLGNSVAHVLDGLPLRGFAGDQHIDIRTLQEPHLFDFARGARKQGNSGNSHCTIADNAEGLCAEFLFDVCFEAGDCSWRKREHVRFRGSLVLLPAEPGSSAFQDSVRITKMPEIVKTPDYEMMVTDEGLFLRLHRVVAE